MKGMNEVLAALRHPLQVSERDAGRKGFVGMLLGVRDVNASASASFLGFLPDVLFWHMHWASL